jgi:phosphotransferase system HPr (HPr) family protein
MNSAHTILEIKNHKGLHSRPCASLAKIAASYSCTTTIQILERPPKKHAEGAPEEVVDASNILNLMMLGASQGCRVKITSYHPNDLKKPQEVIEEVEELFNQKINTEYF